MTSVACSGGTSRQIRPITTASSPSKCRLLGLRRVEDRVAGADHAGVRLDEHQRLVGHLVAQLGGVRGVVAADPDHLAARQHRREQSDVLELVLLVEQLDPDVQRVAGERDDRRCPRRAGRTRRARPSPRRTAGRLRSVNLQMRTRRAYRPTLGRPWRCWPRRRGGRVLRRTRRGSTRSSQPHLERRRRRRQAPGPRLPVHLLLPAARAAAALAPGVRRRAGERRRSTRR